MPITGQMVQAYQEHGFVVLPGELPIDALDEFETDLLEFAFELTGQRFASIRTADFAAFLAGNRNVEQALYDGVRKRPALAVLSKRSQLVSSVEAVTDCEVGILEKIVFRIDLPMVLREIAVWHQDFFYVKGNTETVTAWIPLQDTPYELGCLMVMPGSDKLGLVEHDYKALGKRDFASGIFGREVRYVEMKRGDILLFNALLFHSSGVNISNQTRFSVQARFSPITLPTDAGMGQLIHLRA